MRDTPQRRTLIIALITLGSPMLWWGCGDDATTGGPKSTEVVALDLDSGQRRAFDSSEAVPAGWALCEDARCVIPPELPCQVLGAGACLLSEQCRLKLRCEFDLSAYGIASPQSMSSDDRSGSGDASPPPGETGVPSPVGAAPAGCELVCTANTAEQPCDEIVDQQACQIRSDCSWDWVRVGALPDGVHAYGPACDGEGCEPAPVGYCRPSAPLPCTELDERSCREREGCVWSPEQCPLFCAEDDCDAICGPFCQPRSEPPECEAIPQREPYCPDGQIEAVHDDRGCVVAFECRPICPPAPLGMPECPEGRAEQIRDDRGCTIGYRCVTECPDVERLPPKCPDGIATPKYDDRGCVVGFACVGTRRCEALRQEYAEVLREAKRCQPFAKTSDGDYRENDLAAPRPGYVAQCSLTVPDSLGCPACPTFVNASQAPAVDTLKRLRGEFDRSGCLTDLMCPMIACVMPEGAGCVPGEDGTTGHCADNRRRY